MKLSSNAPHLTRPPPSCLLSADAHPAMFENVCSLPLSADAFAQAIHPTLPIFAVGLASGHVQAFRLPPASASSQPDASPSTAPTNGSNGGPAPPRTARARSSSITSTTGPINTVSTIWRTRRHKGSCRALAFSTDGSTLFSAGIDGLVKAADTLSGRVVGKVALPTALHTADTADSALDPSALLALSPQALVLGTDGGAVHVYTLSPVTGPLGTHAVPSRTPAQTLRPHRSPADPTNAEAIAALAALPPSAASTSRTSRAFVSVAGSTLAVSDLRKGVVACSRDQGDVLLSAACVSLAPPRKGVGVDEKKRKKGGAGKGNGNDETGMENDKVLVGSSEGLFTLWNRGEWEDQRSRTMVGGPLGPAGLDGDAGIECLAVMPVEDEPDGTAGRTRIVAAGLASGAVKLVEIRPGKGAGFAQVVGEVSHDERALEGVAAVGFEAGGKRMMTAGGGIVKVWSLKGEEEVEDADGWVDTDASEDGNGHTVEINGDGEADSDDEDADEEEEDDDDSESEEEEKPRKKKKKGKKDNVGVHGHHGVLAFKGID